MCGKPNIRIFTGLFASVFLLPLVTTTSAFAIPSPELVVGSFVSISQLLALASALLGGGAAYAAVRSRRRSHDGALSRSLMIAVVLLFVMLAGSIGFNIYQYVDQKNERQAALEETILRPSRTPGSLPIDPEVKELSYGQQLKHPDAMTTAEADNLLKSAARGERPDLLFLDVRERAEREMGTLKGVTFVRYPDFAKSGIDFTGKKAILFCHNGNRSHETCEALKKQGIDCKFIVGGVEKWVTEGRAIEGLETRSLAELRAIPDYKNRNTLLTTDEVRNLVEQEKAIFVDARYPFEFKTHGTLPNAINVTIRRIPTDELPKVLGELPKRPIIMPCYDRRGCFFSEVLGLELTRAGHDVRGRYTQPWLYFVKTPRPPHVETWIAENNKSYWTRAVEWLAGEMQKISQWTGVVVAILLLALLSRLLVSPFSIKAERDQLRARLAADEIAAIQERFKGDRARIARAIRGFYKQHNITPVRNLLALAFLPVMAIALLAVQMLSTELRTGFLWLTDLAQRDPYYLLPLVFGLLITTYVHLVFAKGKRTLLIWLAVLPLMIATGAMFGAGADIYLIASATLLLVQRLLVSGWFVRTWHSWSRSALPQGAVPLDDPDALRGRGNKAFRLAVMRSAGMPIPNGVVLTPTLTSAIRSAAVGERTRMLEKIWRHLGSRSLAVRSSAASEDAADKSFAGVFESVINVSRNDLESAIDKVDDSFRAVRTQSYAYQDGTGSVLVQQMLNAEYSGVLFTRDPSAGGLSMVEMVQGTAENLVSGIMRPQTCRFGRISKKAFGKTSAPIDLLPLLALGDKAETIFGCPQDIEWVYWSGEFYLVQSRDITRTAIGSPEVIAAQDEYAKAIDLVKGASPDEIVFSKNELSEMLPRPTPLSLSLMQSLWASGGSVDLAARQLGFSYHAEEDSTYLATILGRLYADRRQEKSRAISIGALAARKLVRSAGKIEKEFREEILPRIVSGNRILGAVDFEKLSASELISEIGRLRENFVHDTHVDVDVVNIAARFYLDSARKALKSAGVDASALLGHIPETAEHLAMAEIDANPGKNRRWLLIKHFGHRAVLDYELSEPRFSEDINVLNRIFAGRSPVRPGFQNTPALSRSVARKVDAARRFQTLKEDAKHHSLHELATLRRAIVSLDQRFAFDGRIFYLTFDELLSLNGENAKSLRGIADARYTRELALRKRPSLPATLTPGEIEAASAGFVIVHAAVDGGIHGTCVSGEKAVEGRARLIVEEDAEHGRVLESFRDGDIIVSPFINPAWLPYFARAGGFVSELGGWLSHPAILAREYGVTMIVGTEGISSIAEGAWLRLHPDGKVEVLASQPSSSAAA